MVTLMGILELKFIEITWVTVLQYNIGYNQAGPDKIRLLNLRAEFGFREIHEVLFP